MTLETGLNVLRLDAGANDALVQALINSAAEYIELATGLDANAQTAEPLCDTTAGFLLKLWYFGDKADVEGLSRIIGSLLKALKAKAEG